MNPGKKPGLRTVPSALSPDALYGKAVLYARRALTAKNSAEEDAYQLWATLALELLGKFALARIHPGLVVDTKNSNSMLEACGVSTATPVRTIDANEVFLRLKHVVPGFNSLAYDACKDLAERRNAELHSGHAAYVGIELGAWEGKLWHAVRLILKATDKDLDALIGEAAQEKEALIENLSHLRRETAEQNIAHAREEFKMGADGKKRSKNQIDELRQRSQAFIWWRYMDHTETYYSQAWDRSCPACGCKGFLCGEKDFEELTDDQDGVEPGFEEIETTYTPVLFICPTCKLKLEGTDELSAADMDDEITVRGEREICYEPEYGND